MQHYSLRAASSFIGGSLHDLNTADSNPGEIEGISDVHRDPVNEDSLDNEDESNSVDCVHDSCRSAIPLHGVGVDNDRSALENSGRSPSPPYSILTQEDVLPIETARARLLQIILDHFFVEHVIEAGEASDVGCYHGNEKASKRKQREVQYEGDPRFALPLMYIANLYETLVNDVNVRLASLDGIREKNIGVALETAGGLYRRLAKKFPPKGPCSFRRRELATSLATRTRFPELVVQEEKRVRFVVVNGISIVEKPTHMDIDDAEWFKRLTGRHEVAISERDYKFYSPRHKYKRGIHSMSSIPGSNAIPAADSSSQVANTIGFRPVNELETLSAELDSLKKDKEYLRINLNRAEEEVKVLFEENKMLDEENKRLLELLKRERSRHGSDVRGRSASASAKNKRKSSSNDISPQRAIDFSSADASRQPLSPLHQNSPGTRMHKK